MDAARAAEMADPDLNPNFRRHWDAPPLKVKRQLTSAKVELAEAEFKNYWHDLDNLSAAGSQSFSDRLANEARAWRSARYKRGSE